MKPKFFFAFLIITGLNFSACDEKLADASKEKVEIYLIDQYEKIGNTFQIKESGITLKSTPLVEFEDILSYTSNTYTFKFSDRGSTAIQNLQHSVSGIAFAIVANDEIIYSAYFWPIYSSMSCDWITTNPSSLDQNNELRIQLGYPGQIEGQSIPDKRNDKRIIKVFRETGKLVE